MSYNITSADYISGVLIISRGNRDEWLTRWKDHLPETNLLDDLIESTELPGFFKIASPYWCGEGSGSKSSFISYICLLKRTLGSADIALCFDGGDSYSGLRVIDGVVTQHELTWVIGKQIPLDTSEE